MNLIDIASYKCHESRFFREHPACLPRFEQMLAAVLCNIEPLLAYYNLEPEGTFDPNPTRPPSHAAGWLVKRAEAALRSCENYHMPWSDPDATSLLERWLHSALETPAVFELAHDARLNEMIAQTVIAMHENKLQAGELLPLAVQLKQQLQQEPFQSIRNMQKQPLYARYSTQQLAEYLAWREALHSGNVRRIDTALALLYVQECQGLDERCKLLRDYGMFDKAVARKLQILLEDAPAELLQQWQLAHWFPARFLFTQADQFLIFQQLSNYKLAKHKLYARNEDVFRACFAQELSAQQALCDLPTRMKDPQFARSFATTLMRRVAQQAADKIKYTEPNVELPEPKEPPKPVCVDFTQLAGIRKQADALTEQLIVHEDEPAVVNINPPPEPEKRTDTKLSEALTQEQVALIDRLIVGGTADELAIEAINELALDIMGDNLIENNEVYEEYIEAWKARTL